MPDAQLSTAATAPALAPKRMDVTIVRWLGVLLVVTVWTSAGLFGLYIIAFYAMALVDGNMVKWNEVLPGLYEEGSRTATTGIGLHFAMGGIILILGSIQLIEALRVRYSAFHRWVGRVYVVASLLSALGGLTFIFIKGTIGGPPMDIGFGLYGILMLVAGIETYRHAAAGRYEQHRAWALRLYALAIGSWLYRMDYGFWFMLAGKLGHTSEFSGMFDRIMAFFFYIPNLVVAEIFIRQRKYTAPAVVNVLSATLLLLMTAFLLTGTYFFTKFYWGPAIIGMFGI
ncbi:DUF2306 domain-containing protein [Dawidia soli]|uniref:DUF2306 domain-containing protein n=1 Tax=Dawidia soli TaxID=2782352 RepID=A0AAP2DD00_9BACT|nr:DUF2306 domain-containing protein [Dawidia soli]MBT1689394.1 DUF2306 domain-containing protein [Dawidia soli]